MHTFKMLRKCFYRDCISKTWLSLAGFLVGVGKCSAGVVSKVAVNLERFLFFIDLLNAQH